MPGMRSTNEDARAEALLNERILDTDQESSFDDLVLIAATAFRVPIAVINFIARDRQWFKARLGVTLTGLPRDAGFCPLVLRNRAAIIIPDVTHEPRWAAPAAMLGEGIRFYAGMPIISTTGHALGTFWIADYQPRLLSAQDRQALEALARRVVAQLEMRRALADVMRAEDELRRAHDDTERRIVARTGELERAVQGLRTEVRERQRIEEELRRSQEQLVRSQKLQAVGQLAGGVAHEFNNILTVIFGYVSVLQADLGGEDPRHADVTRIAESAERAALLTRQLLAFSRHQRLSPQFVDLNELLRRQERMLARIIGENVRVALALSDAACPVRVDPTHVEQVILNLAINARDAMPEGGTFTIETRAVDVDAAASEAWDHLEPGRYIALIVSDTGLGMSPEVQSRVFEPFFTTKEVGKGTGLGLSTVYGIIVQSGGHIRITSREGEGTTVLVLLPRIEAAARTEHQGPASGPTPRGSETILLVEDEPALRDLAAALLRRHGYWVLEAANASDALALCARQAGPIHLLVTDVVMPGMTGAGLARRVLPTRPETRVLYMSGYTNNPEGLGLGPDSDFIGKPFTPAELLDRVRSLLDRSTGASPTA